MMFGMKIIFLCGRVHYFFFFFFHLFVLNLWLWFYFHFAFCDTFSCRPFFQLSTFQEFDVNSDVIQIKWYSFMKHKYCFRYHIQAHHLKSQSLFNANLFNTCRYRCWAWSDISNLKRIWWCHQTTWNNILISIIFTEPFEPYADAIGRVLYTWFCLFFPSLYTFSYAIDNVMRILKYIYIYSIHDLI